MRMNKNSQDEMNKYKPLERFHFSWHPTAYGTQRWQEKYFSKKKIDIHFLILKKELESFELLFLLKNNIDVIRIKEK